MPQDTEQRARLVGGVLIIALGVATLFTQLNLISGDAAAWLWFIGLAAAFAWLYASTREGWALLVAYIAGATALILLLAAIIKVGELIAPLALLLIAAPFFAGWWMNRKQWGLLIPAYGMAAIAVGLLLTWPGGDGNRFVAYVLGAAGAPFLVGWLLNRRLWGLLIPTYVAFAIALAFLLDLPDRGGDLFVAYVMWVIAAPFLVAAVAARQWPLLIPGGILFVIGVAFAASIESVGALVSALVALILIGAGAALLYRAFIERRGSGE